MRETLKPGIRHEFTFVVPNTKTVPELYPESAEFQAMPRVFAKLSHTAPTPPDCPVTVEVELVEVEKRRLRFRVSARDDVGTVSDGTHDRFVIDAERFNAKLSDRQRAAGS
jgi:fluoroacetyl-CoA thioesterase